MKIKLAALTISMFLVAGCGGGGGGGSTPVDTTNTTNTNVNGSGDIASPVDLTQSTTATTSATAAAKYYKAKRNPEEHITVLAKSVGAKARVSLYASDQYLVPSCVVGQLTETAHSCIGSTNEEGYIYFGVEGGDAGSVVTVELLELRDDMHTLDAPLDISDQLPFSSQSNIYVTQDANGYNRIDGDTLAIRSLNPGQHYKIKVESPDLKAVLKIYEDNGFGVYETGDDCPVIDAGRGISECETPANADGEIFVIVEPVFGAGITEYTLSMVSVADQYTGIYDGSEASPKPLNYANDLPYNGGWAGTFTEGYYRITGLTSSERYTVKLVNIQNGLNGFGSYDHLHVNGEDTRVGVADTNGELSVSLSLYDGTFTMVVEPAPANEGTEAAPIVKIASSFPVQAAGGDDDYSWYLLGGLTANADYDFIISEGTYHSIVINVNYGIVNGYINEDNYKTYTADSNGEIPIRVFTHNTEGAKAEVSWRPTP